MADKDLISQQSARDAVEAAYEAFLTLKNFDQRKIDSICEAMAGAALSESARLGKMAVDETGFGVPDDKREKNRFASEDVWSHFRGLKTVGVVDESDSIVEIASPRGVVAAIIPSTNPTSTAIFKIIIAVKSRNSIVLSAHPSARNSIVETTRIMKDVAVRNGLPENAIHCLTESTLEGTEALMKHRKTAVILATGGIGLVRAAYSSGKPAFGVGPGNVPVFVERSADVSKAVADILTGTCFDNGTICASEQSVVVDAPIEKEVREQFTAQGGYFLNEEDADRIGAILVTESGGLNPKIVGRSAGHIASLANVNVPPGTRCLIADCAGVGREFPWSVEKLSPTLAFFVVDGIKAGANRCEEILKFGGMGHTAGMHTSDRVEAVRFGEQMPASRVVINSPTTHGAIGFTTDLAPSMTLGCGSWGGNVTSDNVSPHHLMDIKRVAFETKPIVRNAVASSAAKSPGMQVTRADIAALVDGFLSKKLSEAVVPEPAAPVIDEAPKQTLIHHVNAAKQEVEDRSPVEFVSESDVRDAVNQNRKVIISEKTIVTPAARDLGNEKDAFIEV
jgi:acetaldehyde dehydrogenase (acetylating)